MSGAVGWVRFMATDLFSGDSVLSIRGVPREGETVLLQKTSTRESKHHTWRVGELRFITPAGPEELMLQALSPEQRDYRVFIDRM